MTTHDRCQPDIVKPHRNDSEMFQQLRLHGRVAESLKDRSTYKDSILICNPFSFTDSIFFFK